LGALALVFALGVPAYAFDGASTAAGSLAKALKIAKKADKRSKQALSLAQKVSAKSGPAGQPGKDGAQGVPGAQGPPGDDAQFNGAPAGGDLTGTYPSPQLAGSSVGSAEVTDRSLTADDVGASQGSSGNAGTLAAGACDTINIDPPNVGDVSNDVVAITPSPPSSASNVNVRVEHHSSNPNLFSLKICNNTSTSQDYLTTIDYVVFQRP
jgi:hypothetical protein